MRRALVASFLLAAAAAPCRAGDESVFEKAYSMEGVSRVSIENVNGRIEAQAWDRTYLKVRAVKQAHGRKAGDTLRLIEIRVRKIGEEIRIETVNPRRRRLFGFLDFGSRHARVDYDLHVPVRTETRFETCNGKVMVVGLAGALTCDAVNGSIELKDVAGPVRATTVNGSLRVEFTGPLKRTHLETVNGSIDIGFEKSSAFDYVLETINGRIEGDFEIAVEGKFGPKEARGAYNGGGESLRCETVNGSIRLKAHEETQSAAVRR